MATQQHRIRIVVAAAAAAACLSVTAAVLAAPLPLGAADASWRSVGPPDGTFSSVAGAPGAAIVYAASSAGAVWRSADGGDTWVFAGEPIGAAAPDPNVATKVEAADPQAPATVYASNSTGIWKSTDSGATWTLLLAGALNLLAAPASPHTLYAAKPQASGPLQLFGSADGGASWTLRGTLPAGFTGAFLAVSPSDAGTLYAEGSPGFVRSTDGGATWGAAFAPFAAQDTLLGVFALSEQVVYMAAAKSFGESGAAVYRSADGGATWSPADSGLARPLSSFAATASDTLYGTNFDPVGLTVVSRSADGGATWQVVRPVSFAASLPAGDATTERVFLLTAEDGLLGSADQGASWKAPAQPPSASGVQQVLAGPIGTVSMYAVEENRFFVMQTMWRSSTGGASWSALTPTGDAPNRLLLDAQPGVLYAIQQPPISPPLVTFDDGLDWLRLSDPANPPGTAPLALATDSLAIGKVARLGCPIAELGTLAFACDEVQIHLTNTFGRGWRLLGEAAVQVSSNDRLLVRLDAANPTQAYAVVGRQLLRTVPGSTVLAEVPLAGPFVDLAVVSQGGFGSGRPPILYALLGSQRQRVLFKSVDGGVSWAAASFGLPRNAHGMSLAADPLAPATLYLLAQEGIFVTDDAAVTWQPLAAPGLPAAASLTSIAASVVEARTLYVATGDAGIFVLTR